MAGSKRKHLAAVGLNSNNNALENSSNITADSDLLGEDGWIIVKQQRINILIPRLPTIEQFMAPDLQQDQPRGKASNNMPNTPELPQEEPLRAHLTVRNDADDAMAIPKQNDPDLRRVTAEDQTEASGSFSGATKNLLKFQKTSPKRVRPFLQSRLSEVCHFSTSTMNLDRKMRALNLERKISNAGGLGRWLSSLGLEQFVGILGRKNLNKFHLANLSMKKLKDMGAHAVGPRRKLIHAIECVCQPHCYEFSKNLQNQLSCCCVV